MYFFFLLKAYCVFFIWYIACKCKYRTYFFMGPNSSCGINACHRSGGATWIQMAITDERRMQSMCFFFYLIADKRTFNSLYNMSRFPIWIILIFASECLQFSKGCNFYSKSERQKTLCARVTKTSISPEWLGLESKVLFHIEVHKISFHSVCVCLLQLQHSICCGASTEVDFPIVNGLAEVI